MGSAAPIYSVNSLVPTFFPAINKTIIALAFTKDRDRVEQITLTISNLLIPLCAFITIIVSTLVLSIQLRSKTKWRKQTANTEQADRVSIRNHKVAKMVVIISTMFIICSVPNTAIILAIPFEPALFLNGKYLNVTIVISGFSYVMESINSSTNIFIYMKMSSKYRVTFRKLFTNLKE